jgi:hypothetical protein
LRQRAAADVPQQANHLYLPALQGGQAPLPTKVSAGETVDDSVEPTYIPFDQLPVCPPFTPDPLVPTAAPDLSDTAPRCHVQSTLIVDVRELLEQGIDPAEVGIPGDPLSITPEPGAATPTPFGTPSPSINLAEPVATPVTADAPQQMNHLYLPAVLGIPSSASASARSLATPANSHQAVRLYLPTVQGD